MGGGRQGIVKAITHQQQPLAHVQRLPEPKLWPVIKSEERDRLVGDLRFLTEGFGSDDGGEEGGGSCGGVSWGLVLAGSVGVLPPLRVDFVHVKAWAFWIDMLTKLPKHDQESQRSTDRVYGGLVHG